MKNNMKYVKIFENFEEEEQLKQVARKIIHCGDYGQLFWNKKESKVFWIAADADDGDGGELLLYTDEIINLTPFSEIEKMFKSLPFVKEFEIESEAGPYNDVDFEEIKY